MRYRSCLAAISLLLAACQDNNVTLDDRWPGYLAESCPTYLADLKLNCPSVDLAPPAPKCAAAKGLTGDTLLCVDFKDLATQVLGATNPAPIDAWNFDKADKGCWEINGGKLQVKGFSAFQSSCMFTMPAVLAADFQKYGSFTLSVLQRVDLNSLQQKAQVMLGGDDDQQRLLDWLTGKQPRKQWVQTITKSDLPALSASSLQPWFKLNSAVSAGGTATGWQIESIAVMGNP